MVLCYYSKSNFTCAGPGAERGRTDDESLQTVHHWSVFSVCVCTSSLCQPCAVTPQPMSVLCSHAPLITSPRFCPFRPLHPFAFHNRMEPTPTIFFPSPTMPLIHNFCFPPGTCIVINPCPGGKRVIAEGSKFCLTQVPCKCNDKLCPIRVKIGDKQRSGELESAWCECVAFNGPGPEIDNVGKHHQQALMISFHNPRDKGKKLVRKIGASDWVHMFVRFAQCLNLATVHCPLPQWLVVVET